MGFALVSGIVVTATPAAAATRDIVVHLTNSSDSVLTRASGTLDGGCWNIEPPLTIAIDQTVDIHSESCGVATGTEFHVSYWLDNGTQMHLHYDNPFAGSDTFDETAPEGYAFASGGVIEDRFTKFGCDSACDGIPADWKKNGVTIDPGSGNPPQFVDLPKMGVVLDRPNILVQLDWMEDASHNQQLRQAAIDTAIDAFDKDPVVHRGATRPGITLIVDAGPTSTLSPGGATWGALSRAKKVPWTKYFLTGNRDDGFQQANFYTLLKNNFVPTGRLPSFHYAVAAAIISQDTRPTPPVDDNTSGLTLGDKLGFMVTLGGWTGPAGSQNEQVGSFMHEFGHTLGLDHSGGEGDPDSVNRKPNYPSVMSYAYQTKGVFRGGVQVFDYSRDNMPDVDETKLTEAGGVDLGANPSNYGITHTCGTKDASGKLTFDVYIQKDDLVPTDWNCDGNTTTPGTGFDSNGDTVQGILKGSTPDWTRMKFLTGGVGKGKDAKDTVTIPSSGISEPHHDITFEESQRIQVLPLDATLTYKGATSADYHDPAAVSATLLAPGAGNAPIQGKNVAFQIGPSSSDVCAATTDSTGTASCSIRITQVPSLTTVAASFAGDHIYKPASDSRGFTITREETTLTFTGPTVILAGSGSTTLSAKLVEDGANDDDGDGGEAPPDPHGQTITFTLGTQSCSGTTDATGAATCSIANVSGQTLGSKTLTASFAGDTYYKPSGASAEVIVFAFPSRGAFTLGDTTIATATPNTQLTWWSSDWSRQNSLSGGNAPDSFKGFAAEVTTLPTTSPANSCGATFVTRSGNSSSPTADVPSYMGVIVPSSVTKQGASINGVWGQIVVVKTDAGYGPSPGHQGTGKIVATFCK